MREENLAKAKWAQKAQQVAAKQHTSRLTERFRLHARRTSMECNMGDKEVLKLKGGPGWPHH